MTKTKEELEAEAKAKADAEAKAKADAEARKNAEGSSEDDNEGDGTLKNIDYKKLIQEEKEKREAAEKLIIQDKLKKKSKKNDDDEDEDNDDDDNKPITRGELSNILRGELTRHLSVQQSEQALDIANTLCDSVDEAEYVVEIFKSRRFPEYLSLKERVEEAYAISHMRTVMSKNNELKRALKNKNNTNKNPADTEIEGQKGTAPKIEPGLLGVLQRQGYVFDTSSQTYKKKLPNGKTLEHNPKTGQRRII